MGKVLRKGNDVIGVYNFPDRKKPCLCIGNEYCCTIYGYFQNKEVADEFMIKLAEFMGVSSEWPE